MKQGILILSPIGLGNFLMALPAIRKLKEKFPNRQFGLIALKTGIVHLAEPLNLFTEIHCWEPDRESYWKGLKTIRSIRKKQYLEIYCLFPTGHFKYSLFRSLLGIPTKIGFRYQNFGDYNLTQSFEINSDLHDTEQNYRLISEEEPDHLNYQASFLPLNPGEPYLVCHPGSSAERMMEHKRLPPKDFAQLILKIHSQFGLKTILIGGPEESDLRETILKQIPETTFIQWPTKSLDEVISLVQGARFFLGNDSGLMHLANSLNIPTINFFGPTDPGRTGPWKGNNSPPSLILSQKELDCLPCWTLANLGNLKECQYGDYRCLTQYPLDKAWKNIQIFIEENELAD